MDNRIFPHIYARRLALNLALSLGHSVLPHNLGRLDQGLTRLAGAFMPHHFVMFYIEIIPELLGGHP